MESECHEIQDIEKTLPPLSQAVPEFLSHNPFSSLGEHTSLLRDSNSTLYRGPLLPARSHYDEIVANSRPHRPSLTAPPAVNGLPEYREIPRLPLAPLSFDNLSQGHFQSSPRPPLFFFEWPDRNSSHLPFESVRQHPHHQQYSYENHEPVTLPYYPVYQYPYPEPPAEPAYRQFTNQPSMSHPSVFQTNPLPRLDHPPPVRTTTQSHRVAPSSFSAIHRPNYSAHPYRRPPPPVSSNRAAEYQIGQQFQHQTLPQRLVPTPAARYVGQPNLPGIPMHSGYANLPVASSSSNIPDHVPRQRKGRGNLPKHVTTLLKNWLNDHIDHPYPTEEEKIMLATETNLTLNQINNWFINQRRRHLRKPGA